MNGIHVLTARMVAGEYETWEEILFKIEDRDLTGFLITQQIITCARIVAVKTCQVYIPYKIVRILQRTLKPLEASRE